MSTAARRGLDRAALASIEGARTVLDAETTMGLLQELAGMVPDSRLVAAALLPRMLDSLVGELDQLIAKELV